MVDFRTRDSSTLVRLNGAVQLLNLQTLIIKNGQLEERVDAEYCRLTPRASGVCVLSLCISVTNRYSCRQDVLYPYYADSMHVTDDSKNACSVQSNCYEIWGVSCFSSITHILSSSDPTFPSEFVSDSPNYKHCGHFHLQIRYQLVIGT